MMLYIIYPVSPKTRQGQSTDTGRQKTRFLFGYWNLAAAPLSMPLVDTSMVCPWSKLLPFRILLCGY